MTSFNSNADNSRISTTYANGVILKDIYDNSQRISEVKALNASNAVLYDLTYCYVLPLSDCGTGQGTDTNLRQRVVDSAGNKTIYLYDSLNRACDVRTANGGSQLSHYVYIYDANSNVVDVNTGSTQVNSSCPTTPPSSGTTTQYTYNAANQLSGSHSAGYVYDSGSAGPGAATTDGAAQLNNSYNTLEQTTSQTPSGQSAISYAYGGPQQDDRLSQTQGATTTTFTNSTLGTTAVQVGAKNPTYFIRDNEGTLIEERSWNTGTAAYDTYSYLFDSLGSVVGLDKNGSATSPENSYAYSPFGGATSTTEAVSNPFRFAGYYFDSDTSLYHVGDRYMDPSSGAAPWLQRDPISNPTNPSSWNRYVYVGDDPTNFTDPSGRQGVVWWNPISWITSTCTYGGSAIAAVGGGVSALGGINAGYLAFDAGLSLAAASGIGLAVGVVGFVLFSGFVGATSCLA